jgi:hypothetical protein
MTTAYTSLLGLALPVTGELSGTWGDTVNNSITSLLDTSVAGTTNVSTDTDVTLTTTTGAANTARQAILLFSGARTALRTVVAPAQSKTYTVINATTGGFAVKLVGSGPTTGVTIIAGESAFCAWNGSDFVKVSNTGGAYTVTDLTVTGNTILGDANTDTATVNALGRFNALATFGYAGTTGSTLTTTAPAFVYSGATTYTDTSVSGGTKAHGPFWALAAPTLANPTTATTYTNATTLYIAGAPAAGTNITITNPFALYVAAGASYFGGSVNFAGSTTLTTTTVTSLTDSGLTAGRVTYATTGGLLTDDADLTFDGTTLTAGGLTTTGTTSTGVLSVTGNTTLGDAAADSVTVNGTVTSNLIFTDNTYDIGASGATRPRNLYLAGTATIGSTVTLSGGTANGVMYLNASKQITTGTALSFDASTLLINTANTAYRGQLSLQGGASDFAQITFYRGATSDTNQVGYVHSLNTAGSSQAMVIGARNGAYLKFDVGDSQRAAIDTSGRLLVGVTSGNYALDVGDVSGGNMFRFTRSGTEISAFISAGTPFFGTTSNTVLAIMTNSTERGRFDTSGNLLVNTTNNYAVGATGYVMAKSGYVFAADNTGSANNRNWLISPNGSAAGSLDFVDSSTNTGWPNNAYRMSLTSAGQLLLGVTSIASGFSSLAQLQVSGTNGGIVINSSNTGASDYSRLVFTKLNSSGNEGLIRYNTNDYHMAFFTSASEAGRFTGTGQFLVNATSTQSTAKLVVQGGDLALQAINGSPGDAFPSLLFYNNNSSGFTNASITATVGSTINSGNILFKTNSSGAFDTRLTINQSGYLLLGNASAYNYLNFPAASNASGISWENYGNVFGEFSSGATYLSSNYYPTPGAAGYKTTVTATYGAAGISINGTGGTSNSGIIQFFVNSATAKTAGAAFTPTEVACFTPSGLGLGGATPSSGIGITFPASQSASSNANTLDDYEEGTFTATLKGNVSDPTTPVTTTGVYTKVGNLVTVIIEFNNVNTTGASGEVSVTGLPFTCSSNSSTGNVMLKEKSCQFSQKSHTSLNLTSSLTDALVFAKPLMF